MNCLSKIVFFLLFFLSLNAQAQNLVSNGSFEETVGTADCCHSYGSIMAVKDWFQVTGSTDYYSNCCKKYTDWGVPENFGGFQNPNHGEAYAGIIIFPQKMKGYEKYNFFYREYLHTKLISPLEKDKSYQITFYLSLTERSRMFSDHISIGFSKERKPKFFKGFHGLLVIENKVKYELKPQEVDTASWSKIEIHYKANGSENYFIIGSFAGDLTYRNFKRFNSKNIINKEGIECYYYIDDVSIVPLESENSNTLGTSE